MFNFGRDICNYLPSAEKREWLVTNGIGGFASGTVAEVLTRRYHGLLIAALTPPLGRTLLLTKLDTTATYCNQVYPLFVNRWADKTIEPTGFYHLERFHLEGATPVWTFACADALLEKRIWMQPEANTTYICYTHKRGIAPLTLTVKALVNYRDYHATTHADNWRMQITPVTNGLQITAFDSATPFYLFSQPASITPQHDWYRGFYLNVEAYRGLDAIEDHLLAGLLESTLWPGQSLTIVASTHSNPTLNGQTAYAERQNYEQQLLRRVKANRFTWPGCPRSESTCARHLVLAADQFIARREQPDNPNGYTIIAGYPWFTDWGRDTMIALPGLTLSTGRPHLAKNILKTYAGLINAGILPNRFPDTGDAPEYNSVDAALWYFYAVYHYLRYTKDKSFADEIFPTLVEIIDHYRQGTRYNIKVDPKDGLLYAGEPGIQLTWMDAKVGDWVVTPRIGKPVEVNALWHNALRVMAMLAKQLQKNHVVINQYKKQADVVAENFRRRFWYSPGSYLCDVIDGPGGDPDYEGKRYDRRLRPNQIFAVSLPFKLLTNEQAKAVVDVCAQHLLTPYGLRSLAPTEPAYSGRYGGNPYQRDAAYHQGTVWPWLMGPFVRAYLRVYQNPAVAHSYLQPLIEHLASHCVGSVSEIFDGDPPFTPRGCFAQAWSVAELIYTWQRVASAAKKQAAIAKNTKAAPAN